MPRACEVRAVRRNNWLLPGDTACEVWAFSLWHEFREQAGMVHAVWAWPGG